MFFFLVPNFLKVRMDLSIGPKSLLIEVMVAVSYLHRVKCFLS
jgi:hypothetical protein